MHIEVFLIDDRFFHKRRSIDSNAFEFTGREGGGVGDQSECQPLVVSWRRGATVIALLGTSIPRVVTACNVRGL